MSQTRSDRWRAAAWFALPLLAWLFYLPVLHAGFVWDDYDYVVQNNTLRDGAGLQQIWTSPTASPQYYPLTFTSFWLEYQAWGDKPVGYHVINVLLHGFNALLLWRFLTLLGIRGAWLAAAVFAVHPVHAESVAWISERKNTLSTLLCLSAGICWWTYLQHAAGPGSRRRAAMWLTTVFALFIAATLSKTTAAMTPAVLLVLSVWRFPRQWRTALLSLLPLFIVGMAMGLTTAWLETSHVGATGKWWDQSALERALIASRAVAFYLQKLAWPTDLSFIYPRWSGIGEHAWWYAYPALLILACAIAWRFRRTWGGGFCVALLTFMLLLFPALGFINIYPQRFSFVADHFQYLASTAVFAAAASAFVRLHMPRGIGITVGIGLILTLGALTWQRAAVFENRVSLWADTARINPDAWLVQHNLALALTDTGATEAAAACYDRALLLEPNEVITHFNRAIAAQILGDSPKVEQHLVRVVELAPDWAVGLNELAWRRATDTDPRYRDSHTAIELAKRAVELTDNNNPVYLDTLAAGYAEADRYEDALTAIDKAIALAPNTATTLLAELHSHKHHFAQRLPWRQDNRSQP